MYFATFAEDVPDLSTLVLRSCPWCRAQQPVEPPERAEPERDARRDRADSPRVRCVNCHRSYEAKNSKVSLLGGAL